jgi:hypothetical protein
MTDPVADMNDDRDRELQELAQLDQQLDDQQQQLDQLDHEDPIGLTWFGDNDDWINQRLPGGGHSS